VKSNYFSADMEVSVSFSAICGVLYIINIRKSITSLPENTAENGNLASIKRGHATMSQTGKTRKTGD
jgi:hypothetical protein